MPAERLSHDVAATLRTVREARGTGVDEVLVGPVILLCARLNWERGLPQT